jgi:hypothetical protein
MILTDYSALCIASITGAVFREKITLNDNLLRHIILNKYRELNVKLSSQFGELLVLCDSKSWRKDYFPYYKAHRQKLKDDSVIDWDMVFRVMDEMKVILHENFPFYVVSVKNCEADDLIAAFAYKADSPVCIVSKDKDFYQLQKNPLVKQWDYSSKDFIEINEPDYFRNELIIKGDSGDGVPNILSDDDTFVTEGKRQKPITKKRLQDLMIHTKDDFVSAFDRAYEMNDYESKYKKAEDTMVEYYFDNQDIIAKIKQAGYRYLITTDGNLSPISMIEDVNRMHIIAIKHE